jgi:hypothetical protein
LNVVQGVLGRGFIGPEIDIDKDPLVSQFPGNGPSDASGCPGDQSSLLNPSVHAIPISPIGPDFKAWKPE